MKTFYCILLCILIYTVSFSQEKNDKVKDTTAKKIVKLDEVIITGNVKTDPVLTIKTNDYEKKSSYCFIIFAYPK